MSDSGSPGYVLVDIVGKSGAQLLVIGTRGLGTLSRTILGSVSDYVLHHAGIPVCICSHRPKPEEEVEPSDMISDLIQEMQGQQLEEDNIDVDNFYTF